MQAKSFLLGVLFALAMVEAAPALQGELIQLWDLAIRDQPGQMTVYNPDRDDAQFGTPVRAGDLNGDGFDDLVISAMAGDGPPDGEKRSNAGEVAVYFSTGTIGDDVDLQEGSPRVVTIYGESQYDIFGIKTEVADVDGNGTNDLVVGAFYADGPGREASGKLIRPDAGKLYIIFGELLAELLATDRSLDLAEPWPPGVAVVVGPAARSRLGVWMAAGDIDGDEITDVVVGADQADGFAGPETAAEAGRVYVLYGPIVPGEKIDLSETSRRRSIVYGIDAMDHAGSTVAAGDLDGDGMDDLIVGAAALGTLRNAYEKAGGAGDGPNNERQNAGEAYVLFGNPGWPDEIDLKDDPPADLMVVYGADGGTRSPDRLGEEIDTADINGDGIADLLLGAYRADGPDNSRPDAGEVCVVYGGAGLRGKTLDLIEQPPGTMMIYGSAEQAIIGDALAAGDVHGDGYDDIFVGVPGADGPADRIFSGGIVVIAGGPDLPQAIDLRDPIVPVVWIQAPDAFDFSAYWAASGDIDGDGYTDVIPNGMAGDGPDNRRDNAGEAHIISGRLVAEMLGGAVTAVAALDPAGSQPAKMALQQNYPNPFNGKTTIAYSVLRDGPVDLAIYDMAGRRVSTLVAAHQLPAHYRVDWDGRDDQGRAVASGVYFYRLSADGQTLARRLVLLK